MTYKKDLARAEGGDACEAKWGFVILYVVAPIT
jgi:hypothetical protein